MDFILPQNIKLRFPTVAANAMNIKLLFQTPHKI